MSTDEVFERLSRDTAAERIAGQLRDRIVTGRLAAGQPLREVEIARQLGVSRGPVREAFQRLLQEGLLIAQPAKGVSVTKLAADDIEDLYLARAAIEGTAVRLLATTAHTEEAIGRLEDTLSLLRQTPVDNWNLLSDYDLQFHEALVYGTKSARLIRMFDTLSAETRLCMIALESHYPDHAAMITEHAEILAAIQRRQPSTALRLIEYHMTDASDRLRGRLDDAERLPPSPATS